MILLRCISYVVFSTKCIASSYVPSSGWLLFLSKARYTISNVIVIFTYGSRITYIYIYLQENLFHSITELKLIQRTLNIFINRIYKIIGYYIMECGVGTGN